MHLDTGQRGQCLQIRELARWLTGVLRPRIQPCGEIVDFLNCVLWKQLIAESLQIQPFVGRALQQPVVEVEAVDVDVSVQALTHKEQRRAFARRAPDGRSQSGK